MRLLLSTPIIRRLQRELRSAGRQEIGGLLMGEHLQGDQFRVTHITVQHTGGTTACFIRDPHEHQIELDRFFEQTGSDYKRFNYLGEWHSHPSFAPVPSETDVETMQSIVSDNSVGANFLVLLIVKLDGRHTLQISATAFRPKMPNVAVPVECQAKESSKLLATARQWVGQFFRT